MEPLSLDELFEEAKQQIKKDRKAAHKLKAETPPEPSPRQIREELYSDPVNWEYLENVGLIEKDTRVLVGVFARFRHVKMHSTYRMTRSPHPQLAQRIEYVDNYSLGTGHIKFTPESWDKRHDLLMAVQLTCLHVAANEVPLTIYTRFGATVRAELTNTTTFTSFSGNEILQIPAGTDVFYCFDVDTKIALKNLLTKEIV